MNVIGDFQVLKKERNFNNSIQLWLAEDSLGHEVLILTIQNEDSYRNLLDRLLRNEVQPLINRNQQGTFKILQCSFDEQQNSHYIVYEHKEALFSINVYGPTLKAFIHFLKGLDFLKKQNRFGFFISPDAIFMNSSECWFVGGGLLELFKHQGILTGPYLAPEMTEWISDDLKPRPNFQADIYSAFKCFEGLLSRYSDPILHEAFRIALAHNRLERFTRYSEVLAILDNVKEIVPIRRFDNRELIKVVTKREDQRAFDEMITDMNLECFFLIEKQLSNTKGQITGLFSTKQFSGRFFVDDNNHIFIPYNGCNRTPNSKVTKEGFLCEYAFAYQPFDSINCVDYFGQKREQNNSLQVLNNTHTSLLRKWRTLPEMEREYMEETAFKATFVSREESKTNTGNVRFYLTNEFRNWNKIKDLKQAEIQLSLNGKIIGKVLDYNPAEHSLVVKDARLTLDEIPEKGELLQDIGKETGQFKKQVEAVKRFEKKDIANPELCGILTTPDVYSGNFNAGLRHSEYEQFKEQVFNLKLRTDETQREAVLEALRTKPIYLIQGPPGTGKTTVIVELIQQIIKSKKDVRILVTSQSNLAVDNVLEQLPDHISFMRLAADEEKIGSTKIKEHSFQSKLKKWVSTTRENSELYFEDNYSPQSKDKALKSFYNQYANLTGNDGPGFDRFHQTLRYQNQYIKQLFEKVDSIKAVNKIFESKLGYDYINLKQIQKDWFAFLANTDSNTGDKKKAMLRDGSGEIDFRTAFLKSVNVIGATCIHVASGLYNKVDFRFDYVIMDESSKASPAETLVPVNMGLNIILIGDHKQLPPVVTKEKVVHEKVKEELEDNGLDMGRDFGESLFERLITSFSKKPELQSNIKMLDVQYRMPRQIGHLISTTFYDGKLKNPDTSIFNTFDDQKSHGLTFRNPMSTIVETRDPKKIEVPTSMMLISTSARENPQDNDNKSDRKNQCNLLAIQETLHQLNNLYSNNLSREKPFTIGVIAGYRGQVKLLQDKIDVNRYPNFLLKRKEGKSESLIEINTVDKFQGAEKDIIIYDIVKSSKSTSSIGFLDDYRRINVAFSRAKRLLLVVGDSEYILKRAKLNPDSQFKEFKLQQIVQEFQKQSLIVNSLDEFIV